MSVHNTLYVKSELFTNKVSGTDFTDADWAFLGTVDQDLAKNAAVEFESVKFNNTTNTTKVQTGATGDYTLTLPTGTGTNGQFLTTDGSGALSWENAVVYDQTLNTTDNVGFAGLTVSGNSTLQANLNVTGTVQAAHLTLSGNLTVQGSTTLIDTENTVIKDNIIILNSGQTGDGVGGTGVNGAGTAGIEIGRGSAASVNFLFNEPDNRWVVGRVGTTIGNGTYYVSELAESTQTQGSIPGFDANGRLKGDEGLTAGEVNQLQNIDTTTITGTQWGYLGSTDQPLATNDSVTFNGATLSGDLVVNTGSNITNSVSAVITTDSNDITDRVTVFDTSSGIVGLTLPDARTRTGKIYTIVLQTAGNELLIDPGTSGSINGSAEITLDVAGQHLTVMSDGSSNWLIL